MLQFRQRAGVLTIGLLLAAGSAIAAPEASREMTHPSTPNRTFQRLEQPLEVKLGVTAAGLVLMGLELWWFLGSKPRSSAPRS